MSNTRKKAAKKTMATGKAAPFPRHTIEKCLRIAQSILDQNAGRGASNSEIAAFLSIGLSGELKTEISSAVKYCIVERHADGKIWPTEIAKRMIRPQVPDDTHNAAREALLKAPQISDVYNHYRGEYLPDKQFLENALRDKFAVPGDKLQEFLTILMSNLEYCNLLIQHDGKQKLFDVGAKSQGTPEPVNKNADKSPQKSSKSCFVMMPFANPFGGYFSTVFEKAISNAGLTPIRADTDIFGTGKIMDQIIRGIRDSTVLLAELTSRNPNVFYELGIAHALKKPVILVSSNEGDVPFDLRHVRVIYYDTSDPFWGEKLIAKISEKISLAITNPEEAVLPLP